MGPASESVVLGDVTVTRVIEWRGPVATVEVIIPDSEPEMWRADADLAPDFWDPSDGAYKEHVQTWVVRSGGRVIVIDTGVGNGRSRPNMPAFDQLQTGFLKALGAAGITPEAVDVVVNTHLHGDHVGWNTRLVDGRYVPTFPNAEYLMPRAEVDFWDPSIPVNSTSAPMMLNVFEDSVAPVLEAGQARLWEDSHVIDDFLRLVQTPGHTPGMAVAHLQSSGERAVFAADALHSPIQVRHPELNSCFCEDAALARAERGRLLRWAADSGGLVLPSHFAGHSAFTVQETGGRFAVRGWADFPRLQ